MNYVDVVYRQHSTPRYAMNSNPIYRQDFDLSWGNFQSLKIHSSGFNFKTYIKPFSGLQRIQILPHFASLCRLSLFESSKSEVSTKFSPFLSSNAMYTPMDQTSETHNSQRMNKKNTIVLSPSSLLILLFFSECSEHIMAFNTLQSFCTSFLWYKPCGIMLNTQY